MQLIQTDRYSKRFNVVANTPQVQAAMMTLRGGSASDEELSNEHANSEQWLFVISGTGTATVIPERGKRRTLKLRPGSLLIIERGDLHQIKHAGRGSLRTINFYAPPAYKSDATLRPATKSRS
jgi:oxalate decarboxylase/phosphoglucose isomerase-like protein (cupin superfamily)